MPVLKATTQGVGTLFPPMSRTFYDAIEGPGLSPPAAAIHAAARRPATFWQRWWVKRLTPAGRLAVLLGLHREAFEAECALALERADFYWSEFYSLLPRLLSEDEPWRAIQAVGGEAAEPCAPDVLRGVVCAEIVVQAHRGFAATCADDTRIDWHLSRVLVVRKAAALTWEQERSLIALFAGRITRRLEANDVASAVTLATTLVGACPDDRQCQALRIHAEMAMAFRAESTPRLYDLGRAITSLEAWRGAFDDHPLLYESLGALYLARAVQLANTGSLADALVDVAKAEAAAPQLENLDKVARQAHKLMRDLQDHLRSVESRLATTPGATLNAEGQRLRAESRRGFEPATAWSRSQERKGVEAGRERGQGMALWREVGLPSNTWSPDRAAALVEAFTAVARTAPNDSAAVRTAWGAAASARGLADVDAERVAAFISGRLDINDEESWPVPAIDVAAEPGAPKREPVRHWLASRSARRVRWQLAAVAVLGVVAVALGAREARRESVRDRAWDELRTASAPAAVLGVAERFFSVGRPLTESAARERAVWDAYAHSIVSVAAAAHPESDAELTARVERFALVSKDYPDLVTAAE